MKTINIKLTKKGDEVQILITGKKSNKMQTFEKAVLNLSVLANDDECYTDEVLNDIINNVREDCRSAGRPSSSCFENPSAEYRQAMIEKVRNIFFKHFNKDRGFVEIDDYRYKKEAFCACLSKAMISRFDNQTDFVRFLGEAGITVQYRSFVKTLDRLQKNKQQKYIKLGQYLVEFFASCN